MTDETRLARLGATVGYRGPRCPARFKALRPQVIRVANGLCAVCDEPAVEVDHITPRCRGGGDLLENLQALCRRCHALKTEHLDKKKLAFDRKLPPMTLARCLDALALCVHLLAGALFVWVLKPLRRPSTAPQQNGSVRPKGPVPRSE